MPPDDSDREGERERGPEHEHEREPASGDRTADEGGLGPEPGRLERALARLAALARRLQRLERRELVEFRRWMEDTENLVHLSVLLFVPVLVAVVTQLSNTVAQFSFLLFPPLASGTYTLFANPEGRYADPVRFVVGLTAGATCGWAAAVLAGVVGPASGLAVNPRTAAFSILLAGVVTWALDVEEPSAFSAALLVLAAGERPELYVLFTLLGATVIAVAFAVWREWFYERRAALLYGTTRADDHVLVPVRGENPTPTALFGARLAAAHDAGKVVLLSIVEDGGPAARQIAAAREVAAGDERSVTETLRERSPDVPEDAHASVIESADRLEALARRVRTRVGVPCSVAVAAGDPVATLRRVARETNCDLVVTPYEEDRGLLSEFVRAVFRGPLDTVAFRSRTGRERWRRVLVPVSRPADSAHAMVDFATRLAGRAGTVSVCTCIDREAERRPAEDRLANVVETADRPVETRVARADVLSFIEANADTYDLVMVGASRDRSVASRVVSPPTFERLRDLECDVAVVDRADPP